MNKTEWTKQLSAEMRKAMKRAKRTGTTAMSRGNLWQITRIPNEGGPVGANAVLTARQMFNNIIDSDRYLRQFTFGE